VSGFVRDQWYAAASSDELPSSSILSRTVLDERVALLRTESGHPAALLDRCPHRLLPLSCGRVKGETVECGYHGLTFDPSGRCVRVPGQARIPPGARVRSFPVTEKYGLVWIWPGDPALADPGAVFDIPQFAQPGWELSRGPYTRFATNYQNITDNLVDPAHTTFVHQGTLGGAAAAEVPVETAANADSVVVSRWIPDAPPVPIMTKYFRFQGNVDRWQYYHLFPPAVSYVDFGAIETGRERSDAERNKGFRILSFAFLTPETDRSTHYFWFQLRNFALGDTQATKELVADFARTFDEDRLILEQIQRVQDRVGIDHEIRIAIDKAAVCIRRMTAEKLMAETERSRSSGPMASASGAS
jgi:vanillate O-demethylase monooxygenase subunit